MYKGFKLGALVREHTTFYLLGSRHDEGKLSGPQYIISQTSKARTLADLCRNPDCHTLQQVSPAPLLAGGKEEC